MVRQARSEATRQRIIDSAVDLINEIGYPAAGLADIIERAEMTKGALYYHFDSKEALASAIMGFPLMVRAIRLSIAAIDRRLEVAARTLGGSPPWVFASVTLPLALPGIITGSLLSFARGLGEFGATITFVSNIPGETETLPLAIYSFTQVPGGDASALRLSIIAVVLSAAALIASEWLTRRFATLHVDDRR